MAYVFEISFKQVTQSFYTRMEIAGKNQILRFALTNSSITFLLELNGKCNELMDLLSLLSNWTSLSHSLSIKNVSHEIPCISIEIFMIIFSIECICLLVRNDVYRRWFMHSIGDFWTRPIESPKKFIPFCRFVYFIVERGNMQITCGCFGGQYIYLHLYTYPIHTK